MAGLNDRDKDLRWQRPKNVSPRSIWAPWQHVASFRGNSRLHKSFTCQLFPPIVVSLADNQIKRPYSSTHKVIAYTDREGKARFMKNTERPQKRHALGETAACNQLGRRILASSFRRNGRLNGKYCSLPSSPEAGLFSFSICLR